MTTPTTLTLRAFAQHLGCAPSYVTKLKQAGRLVLDENGKVKVVESKALIESTRDPAKRVVSDRHAEERGAELTASAEPSQDSKIGSTYQAARAVKEKYLAMAARRDYEISIGKLLDAGEVRAALFLAVTTLRTRLESIPEEIGPPLAAIRDERQAVAMMTEAIERSLSDLAREFSSIGAPRE